MRILFTLTRLKALKVNTMSAAPKDKADRIAEQYENSHHEKAGNKNSNATPSGQSKLNSVRTE